MQSTTIRALIAASVLSLAGATHSPAVSAQATQSVVVAARSESTAIAPATRVGFMTSHVIVMSIDGLRPDAIEKFGATTMQRLMKEGSYTLAARTIFPSKTLPSHTSMLTG